MARESVDNCTRGAVDNNGVCSVTGRLLKLRGFMCTNSCINRKGVLGRSDKQTSYLREYSAAADNCGGSARVENGKCMINNQKLITSDPREAGLGPSHLVITCNTKCDLRKF